MNTLLLDHAPLGHSRRSSRLARRMRHIDDDERLAVLRGLARDGAPVTTSPASVSGGGIAGPVELRMGTRRIGCSRVHAATWQALHAAAAGGQVTLAGAGRYGRSWVLQFAGPGAPLVLLAERIRLLPEADAGADQTSGSLQLAS